MTRVSQGMAERNQEWSVNKVSALAMNYYNVVWRLIVLVQMCIGNSRATIKNIFFKYGII